MSQWTVEVIGESRELYTVEAETEEEALANWPSGDMYLQETSSAAPVRATRDDD